MTIRQSQCNWKESVGDRKTYVWKEREKNREWFPKKLPWATGWVTVLLNKIENILGLSLKSDDL